MSWQAIAVSAVGEKHIKAEEPCQDCAGFTMLSNGQVLVGAVSDGMGSAAHSELGSHITVKVVVSQLSQEDWLSEPLDERFVSRVFRTTLEAVKAELTHQAQANGYLLQDLSCTLIAFVATPTRIFAMQVGDGLLVVRSSQGKYELLFKPDKGEFANETTSVTSAKSLLEMQTCMRNISYQFVCAATDGVENLSLVKSEDWRPFEKFFEPLEKHIFSEKPLITKEGELRIFLNSNKINQSTDDDKTLLLCAFQKSTAPQKYQIEQEDSLQSGEEVPLEKPKVAASSKFSKSEAVRDVALSRSSSVNQDIIQALKLLTDELNEQGYQNVTPRLEVKTELIEVILLSNEPLVYQRSLGQAIYRCVHSLKNSRTKDITVVNYFRAGVYRRRRHWVKRLPGFLGLFL